MDNRWYVITGAPCSGKTTIIEELQKRGYRVVPEAARQYIDSQLSEGKTMDEIRGDYLEFQKNILDLKLLREEYLSKDEVVFLDRGIPDTRAYLRYRGTAESEHIRTAVRNASYRRVFILEPLPLENDPVRTETPGEQLSIHKAIEAVYREGKFDVVLVPVLPVAERIEFILDRLA